MNFEEIVSLEKKFIFPTYMRYPIAVVRGKGSRVYDPQGREYLDLLAGISVCNLGHCHPEIAEVICTQAKKLLHISNLFYIEEQVLLAQHLLSLAHFDKIFFCNSGAEANEAAIKLARKYMQEVRREPRFEIITLEGSFHGRTLATLSATGQDKVKIGFSPLVEGFKTVPPEEINILMDTIGPHTAGVMIEIIQGEGGVRPLSASYLQEVQQLCNKSDILLIVDEVQTGMGRTGKFWAHQHLSLTPDILTCAKALANGLPMGAMMSTEEVARGFGAGSHATTFGGSPIVSAVAKKVVEIIERDNLVKRAEELGKIFFYQLDRLAKEYPHVISEIRGQGLMIGIELKKDAEYIFNALLQRGFISNLTQGNTLRLLPPLIIEEEEIFNFLTSLEEIVKKLK